MHGASRVMVRNKIYDICHVYLKALIMNALEWFLPEVRSYLECI